MIKRHTIVGSLCLALWAGSAGAAPTPATNPAPNLLRIRSVEANGKPLSWRSSEGLRLSPFPENIWINFGPATNAARMPLRLRYKLEGYDTTWHEGGGEMFLAVRYLDAAGEQIGQRFVRVRGESAGWNGALESAALTHRRETLAVPAGAALLQVVISSAGPPSTVGLYVVDGLVVSKIASSNAPERVLMRAPFSEPPKDTNFNISPPGWMRDGSRPSMARVITLGQTPATRVFAVLDDDPFGHAEWHSLRETAPSVAPGDQLLLEWNELFTMGTAIGDVAHYEKLPQGDYRFRVVETTALGLPTGVETALAIRVPPPFWRKPWFWGTAAGLVMLASAATGRYVTWRRVRGRMGRLRQERMVEQERVRIAQNIHDDLGARVTQISLLSGVAQSNPEFPEKARADFDRISRMSRELVSALYETVWAVNPENDNLDALGNYLCQMVNQLCSQAQLRCRLDVRELPREVQVSSHTRHHLTMAVKEAVHNVIKHARASELTLRAALAGPRLTIRIEDNGSGFDPDAEPAGHGLANMKRRLADLGGSCTLESQAGQGTKVVLDLAVGPGD